MFPCLIGVGDSGKKTVGKNLDEILCANNTLPSTFEYNTLEVVTTIRMNYKHDWFKKTYFSGNEWKNRHIEVKCLHSAPQTINL